MPQPYIDHLYYILVGADLALGLLLLDAAIKLWMGVPL